MTDNKKFSSIISDLANDHMVDKDVVVDLVKSSIIKAVHQADGDAIVEVEFDPDRDILNVINKNKLILSDEDYNKKDSWIAISESDARKINSDLSEGDEVEAPINIEAGGKLTKNIYQTIIQSLKEMKKKEIYAKHKSLVGETVKATITNVSQKFISLRLLDDGTTAIMFRDQTTSKKNLNPGKVIDVYVEEVKEESKDAQIIVSTGSRQLLKRMVERNVPEVKEGTVEIVAISRIPGERSKIAVKSENSNIDAAGAIIGTGGARIRAIVSELDNEQIDIINYSSDENLFVATALSPAIVVSVIDKTNIKGDVVGKIAITPNRHQTLAIGKRGMNVRLAAELTKQNIDVISVDQAKEKGIDIVFNVGRDESVIERVENGEIVGKVSRKNNDRGISQRDLSSLDSSIDEFNNDIYEETSSPKYEEIETSFSEDNRFTEEQLKQMQQEFDGSADFDLPSDFNADDFADYESFNDNDDEDY